MKKKAMGAVVLAFCAMLVSAGQAPARVIPGLITTNQQPERVPGVLVVNFKPDALPLSARMGSGQSPRRATGSQQAAVIGIASVDALNARWRLQDYRPLFPGAKAPAAPTNAPDLRGFLVLDFDPGIDLDQAASEYLADPNVASVEFDFYANIMRTPNDTYYSQMWELNQANGHDIDAPEAWDRSVGAPSTILADTDTGVLYTHPDLKNNIWVNPGEDLDSDGVVFDLDDVNGIDDDGNGYIDDFIGYDFVAGGSDVWPGEDGSVKDNDPIDFNGHGTHTSGTIAATTNNGTGVAGIAGGFGPSTEPGCKIMCLRMGYSFNDNGYENGRTHMSYVAEAFRYAADNGAVAINYSFGSSNSGGIAAATDYAIAAGLVISAAAGNDNNSSFGYLQSRSDVICVASTNSGDKKSGFSNYGAAVDVSAPGSSITSTVSNHYSPGYATYGGTSMAAPHVVGLVGLIRSLNPLLTRQEVTDLIINNADNIDGLNPAYVGQLGSGRINAFNSLSSVASANFTANPRVGQSPLTVQFTDSSQTPATSWKWYFGDGDSAMVQNPVHTYAPGLYDVTLRTGTSIGNGIKTKFNFVASLAETLTAIDTSVLAGQPAVINLYGVNKLPVDTIMLPIIASNIMAKGFLDSVVTTGCRTEYLTPQVVFDNRFFGQLAVRMAANDTLPPLPPGEGLIAKIWFRTKSTDTPGDSIAVEMGTLGSYSYSFQTGAISYAPVYHAGSVRIGALIGDLDFSGAIDAVDLGMLIDIIYFAAPPPTPPEIADINCDGPIDAVDLSVLIDYIFFSGPAPCQ